MLADETREFILLYYKNEITSRDQVVQLTQRYEELEKPRQRGDNGGGSARPSQSSRSSAKPRNFGNSDPSSTSSNRPPFSIVDTIATSNSTSPPSTRAIPLATANTAAVDDS